MLCTFKAQAWRQSRTDRRAAETNPRHAASASHACSARHGAACAYQTPANMPEATSPLCSNRRKVERARVVDASLSQLQLRQRHSACPDCDRRQHVWEHVAQLFVPVAPAPQRKVVTRMPFPAVHPLVSALPVQHAQQLQAAAAQTARADRRALRCGGPEGDPIPPGRYRLPNAGVMVIRRITVSR